MRKLREAVGDRRDLPSLPPLPEMPSLSRVEKIEQLKTRMTAMRSEVYVISKTDPKAAPNAVWTDRLKEILREKGLKHMLYAPGTPVGDTVTAAWAAENDGLPEGATGAGLLCFASGRTERHAVDETVKVLKDAGMAPLE
ncbi:MAG: hypothetical protein ACWGNK_08475, partial [Desulfobacterales bacterium]